jgi:hypothetical protein
MTMTDPADAFPSNRSMAEAAGSAWTSGSRLRRLFLKQPDGTDPFAVRQTTALTMSLPSADDGIDFDATIYVIWEASYGSGQLTDLIARQQPIVELGIREQLRAFTRVYQPEDASNAERELSQRLRQAPAVVEQYGQCRPWLVTLDHDPAVRQQHQKEWATESEARQCHNRALARITEIDQLRLAWDQFLATADGGSERTAEAVRLALRPEDVPAVVLEAASRRQDTMEGLQMLCERAIEAHRQQDVFDFVVRFDSALRNLMNHLGRPTPIDAEWQELLGSTEPLTDQPGS